MALNSFSKNSPSTLAIVRLPDPVTPDAVHALFGNGLVELVQQVVSGLDRAAGDPPVIGKHQRAVLQRRHAEFRARGAKGFQHGPVTRFPQGSQLEADGSDVQTDIDTHFGPV